MDPTTIALAFAALHNLTKLIDGWVKAGTVTMEQVEAAINERHGTDAERDALIELAKARIAAGG